MDIYLEQILATDENMDDSYNENYIFVDVVPTSVVTLGATRKQIAVYIDIACHKKSESNKEYLLIVDKIINTLCPALHFEKNGECRAITIPNIGSKIVDKVLHCDFTVSFVDDDFVETAEYMGKLEKRN